MLATVVRDLMVPVPISFKIYIWWWGRGNTFVSNVLMVSGDLNLEVFSLKISQHVVDGFHGVIGSGSGLHEGGKLRDVEGGGDTNNSENDEDGSHF